jgi:hypothetical protein
MWDPARGALQIISLRVEHSEDSISSDSSRKFSQSIILRWSTVREGARFGDRQGTIQTDGKRDGYNETKNFYKFEIYFEFLADTWLTKLLLH